MIAYRILIVDDHPMVRQGLRQIIEQQWDLAVCGEAEDVLGALREAERSRPDLAIVDLTLKDGSGLDLVKRLRSRRPRVASLVFSMHEEAVFSDRARLAGARGYLVKQEASEHIIEAIRRIKSGRDYFGLLQGSGEAADLGLLSDRELEVFRWIGKGLGTVETAEKLRLSPKTVEAYRAHIKDKLQLQDAAELRQCAIRWALKLAI